MGDSKAEWEGEGAETGGTATPIRTENNTEVYNVIKENYIAT